MKVKLFFKHCICAIRYGEWECGFASKKEWPDKETLYMGGTYYDGFHFAVHVWRFYIYVYYF